MNTEFVKELADLMEKHNITLCLEHENDDSVTLSYTDDESESNFLGCSVFNVDSDITAEEIRETLKEE